MNKRVLFIASVAKKHILQFHIPYMKWFKEQGYTVDVCAGNDFDPGEKAKIPYCDNYYAVPFYRSPFAVKNISSYRAVKRLAKENSYDLIHCHTPIAAAIARFALRKKHKKDGLTVLYTAHGFHFYKGAPKVYKLYYTAEKLLVPYTDALITINDEDYKVAQKLCANKKCLPFLIPGIGAQLDKVKAEGGDRKSMREQFGIPQDAFMIMSNSEINANKNVMLSVRAAASIPDVYMLVCGNGSKLEECKTLAKQLGAADRIIFAGYRYDAKALLSAADAFIFPSRREGLGLAAIEAMAAGLPLISAANRGTLEYAVDGVNALLYDPGDFLGFCGAIRRLSGDRELCRVLGENGKRAAEKYDLPHAIDAMTAIYKQMLPIEDK